MKKKGYSFPTVFAVAVALLLIFYPQKGKSESPRTITLSSGEVVCDLNGEWNALFDYYGGCAWGGKQKVILQIKQEGNKFVAIKLSGGDPSSKGNELIRGEIDQKGFKKVETFYLGWSLSNGKITNACKKMVIDNPSCTEVTLERK
jgi:hypothetical protein